MDKICILILINSFLYLRSMAQVIQEKLTVPMSLETRKIPFTLNGVCMTEIYNGSRDKFKGIPIFLTPGNSIIKTIYFGRNSPLNKTFYLIIGDKSNGDRICIIDTNDNLDFSDDYQYTFNDSLVQKDVKMLAQPLHFKYFYKNQEIERTLYLRPEFFGGSLKYVNNIEQKYFIILRLSEYRQGVFFIKDKKYKVAAAMPTPRPLYDSQTVFSIINSEAKFPANTDKLGFYKIEEPIIAGKSKFKVTGITRSGDSLCIEYMGSRNLKEIGYQKGFYAPEIIRSTVSGTTFKLSDYQGKFVLIDFWGTWCVPCIALIPEIRKLHAKYKKLVLVSIACENEEQAVVKTAIKKYKMNWINLYESFIGSQPLINAFNVNTFPTTILINSNGRIIFRGNGDDFKSLVKLLEEDFN